MKKIISFILCVSMVFVLALGTTGFAQVSDSSKGTITVNGVQSGASVTAYKIVQVNFKEGYFTGYSYVQSVKNWMAGKPDYASLVDDISKLGKLTATQQEGFYAELAAAITADPATFNLDTYTATSVGAGLVFSNVALGQYLLLAEGGDYIYHATVANVVPKLDADKVYQVDSPTVDIKAKQVTINKTVNEAKQAVAGLDDTLHYTILADVPVYPAKAINKIFTITDTLSTGLALNSTTLAVYGVKAGTAVALSGYFLTINGQTITINFLNYDAIKEYAQIKVVYDAKITSAAIVGGEGNINTAKLTYTNNPNKSNSSITKDDKVEVYTFGLKVLKLDGDTVDSQSVKKLAGAIFGLEIKSEQGEYVVWTDVGRTAAELTTKEDGTIEVKQLKPGEYRLVELQAPDGYNMLETPVEFEIIANQVNGKYDGTVNLSGDGYFTQEISNWKTILPGTGGSGTMIFTVIGLVLMMGSVAFIVIRKRMAHVIK